MQSPSENRSAYKAYLNRDGPRALGSKEIPQVSASHLLSIALNLINDLFMNF